MLILIFLCVLGIASTQRSFSLVQSAQNIQTRVIEGFETPGTWEVKFSKFRSPYFDKVEREAPPTEGQTQQRQPEDSQSWLAWFTATERDFSFLPDGLPPEVRGRTEKTILGVRATFEVKGYNWIVVQPKKPLPLYGIVKSLDVWVWGGGYDYDVEFIVKDYFGFYHTLAAGDLKHYGWKNLRVTVPEWVPQAQQYLPRTRPLTFIRFKITSKPFEREDNFHAYFDYIQVQTDIYTERFNGDDLVNLDWKQRGVRATGEQGQQQQQPQQGASTSGQGTGTPTQSGQSPGPQPGGDQPPRGGTQ